jgi:hypothetical protein
MKIMKKFLFLKIFLLTLYSPTIFAITCSTGSGGSSSPATYTWTEKTTNPPVFAVRDSHSSVEFDGKVWVIGGFGTNFSDEAWSSTDGVNWTEETKDSSKKFAGRSEHSSIVYDEHIWIIGGRTGIESNDVWRSDDGKNWEQVKPSDANGFSRRVFHTAVVFDGDDGDGEKMWVIGGQKSTNYLDDVWSSTNGKTWTEETKDSSKKFSARTSHQSVVFDDGNGEKIWIIGGGATNDVKKDVWNSEDGKNWKLVTSSATFGIRTGHQSVVFDDKMWVIGGNTSFITNLQNDVWNSTNGITWTEETDNNPRFSGRASYAAEVFDNKIWVFGGFLSGSSSNDVWSMVKD